LADEIGQLYRSSDISLTDIVSFTNKINYDVCVVTLVQGNQTRQRTECTAEHFELCSQQIYMHVSSFNTHISHSRQRLNIHLIDGHRRSAWSCGVINPSYHCRQSARDRQYECDRGTSV